jgi:hypothetical protein
VSVVGGKLRIKYYDMLTAKLSLSFAIESISF